MTLRPRQIPNYHLGPDVLIPAFEALQRWMPEDWKLLGDEGSTFSNGWRPYLGDEDNENRAMFRRWGDTIEFRGLIDKAGANFIASEIMFTMPEEYWLPADALVGSLTYPYLYSILTTTASGGSTPGPSRIDYQTLNGTMVLINGAPANPVDWVNLNNLRVALPGVM